MRFRVVPVKNYFIRMIIIKNYHMTYRQSRQIQFQYIWTYMQATFYKLKKC